jgi:hypothetical protein
MTLNEAFEYIDQAHEAEGEQRAEYGSGCVSLGYDPYEWAPAYEGYRCSDDDTFAAAQKIVREYYEAKSLVRVIQWPTPVIDTDDIPF